MALTGPRINRFGLTIFISAFLLFQVQPILGKHFLPFYGGSPSVWTTCMLFFQVCLCLGYAAAHAVVTRLTTNTQRLVMFVLAAICVTSLGVQAFFWDAPMLLSVSLDAARSSDPTLGFLAQLGLSVGLPFVLLSMTSVLLQSWIYRVTAGKAPYAYYALSNAGSMLALLSYPFLIEAALDLTQQAFVWMGLFVVYAVGLLVCAWPLARSADVVLPAKVEDSGQGRGERLRLSTVLLWLGLSACPSALLIATTNQICQEISSTPFLWVLPLVLYLLSFILTFQGERLSARRFFGPLLFISSFLALGVLVYDTDTAWANIGIHSLCLFSVCMACHGELSRSKPHPASLTVFYFSLSVGGALGGVFCSLVAPLIFDGYFEYHVALTAGVIAFCIAYLHSPAFEAVRRRRLAAALLMLLAVGLGGGLLVDSILTHADSLEARRNFYGVLRIERHGSTPDDSRLAMMHGPAVHGAQFVNYRRDPVTAFGPGTGLAAAIELHPLRKANRPMRVGVVGTGVGTIAAWGRAGDHYRFYELNPQVSRWASGESDYFTFLKDSPAHTESIDGDGRISLQHELESDGFQALDVLVIDAFAGGAPPTHLLTLEAFELYRSVLAEDGILAIHCTNSYLHLGKLVLATARKLEWPSVVWRNMNSGRTWYSLWVLLSHNRRFLEEPSVAARLEKTEHYAADVTPWTDRFSNLFDLLE